MFNWVKIPRKVALFLLFGVWLAGTQAQAGLLPTASFTASQTSVATGTEVSLDASVSRDSRGYTNLEYSWDFERDFSWTDWSRSPRTTHIFAQSGDFIIYLKVRDSAGYEDETAVLVRVQDRNGSPNASFTVSPEAGDEGTEFTFTALVISQIGTPTSQLEVRWDFDGNGTWDTNYSYDHRAVHVYGDSWVVTPRLQARDTNGATRIVRGYENDLDEVGRLRVGENGAPEAAFRTTPIVGEAGSLVYFDAGESQRAVEYRWDFDGNGKYDVAWTKDPKVQYLYDRPGEYSAVLEVRNANGLTDQTERTISILTGNLPPEAWFTVRNLTNTSDASLGAQGDEFRFDASRSRDRDSQSSGLQYRWDFEGDGVWDTDFATTRTATHRYTALGEYSPYLQVLDNYGAVAAAKAEIRIVANTPPVAKLGVLPTAGVLGTEFRFSASGSTDSQSRWSDLWYRFDFEGDGVFDTEFARTYTARHRYSSPGTYRAVVEVRDSAQAVGVANLSVVVVDAALPPVSFTPTPAVGVFSTTFTFDASGVAAALPEGLKLWYRWDFDSTGPADIRFDTGWQTRPTATHRYREVGTYRVRLMVKNAEGELADTFREITVHASSPYFAELQKRGVLQQAGDPEGLLTRQELALLVAKAAKLQLSNTRMQYFTDVEPSDTYARYILATVQQGWFSPRANFAFNPAGIVNRAELTKVALVALYPRVAVAADTTSLSDVGSGSWYYRFALTALREGLISLPDTLFRGTEAITRAEAIQLIATLLTKYH